MLIDDSTRTTYSTATLIDHIITNKPDIVGQSGVILCGISGHDLIFMIRKARLPKLKILLRVVNAYNHNKFDLKAIQLDIQLIPFDIIKTVSKDEMTSGLNGKHSFSMFWKSICPLLNSNKRRIKYRTSMQRQNR